MTLFPLFADLNGRAVLVVGGGAVAERKVTVLLGAGASVDLVAPTLTPELTEHARNGRLRHLARRFAAEQADGRWLVIAATDDAVVNAEVANAAKARRIFVNVVDDAALSTFHVPAVVDRSPLVIAISSGGAAPMLARLARERIETWFDHSWGTLAELLAKMRSRIRARLPVVNERRRFYDWLLRSPLMQLVQQQRSDEAEQAIAAVLAAPVGASTPTPFGDPQPVGHVTLVGAGPGDPGLVTLHALRALNEADVVLHDRLVSEPILDLARRDAERIDVGKIVGKHHTPQDSIHRLMLTHALAGKRVVRLKGGDPFVFGRGGEEIEFLREHGVPYSIVPGITAAVACAAYAGVPLTHRDRAQVVRFATAHRRRNEDESDALSAGGETLAIYMGVAEFANVRDKLYDENLPASTPFAIIENGTRPEQRVFVGTLAELVELATAYEVKAPALLVVGEVAQIGAGHHWFGAPPVVTTAPTPDRRAARS